MADWKEQSLRFWQKLGVKERYLIIGSSVLLFIAIMAWSYWWGGKPDLVPLFTGMEARDAGEVAAKLKELKITYEPQETANGTAILVQAKDVHRVRLELASQGLPRGYKGFEIFDQNKFGVTEFQNKVYFLQALQGELTRTIEQMAEVEKARVHIVLPEDSLYKKNEKPATASIMLKLRPSAQLNKQQIKGIVNLVAHSIQGLKPENVTIIDNLGRILNELPENEMSGAVTLTQLEMTKKVQEDLQKNVQSLLDQVLGSGKAAARVSVELNFDQRTVDRQVFEPVVDDKGIIRSSQESNESYSGNSMNPGGPAGTASNIPGYVAGNNNQSNYEKKEVTRNFEINETKEKIISSPGAIRRLTVAVLVDENINKAQQDSIAKTVSSAIGLNTARGDVVSIESIPFSTELANKQLREEQEFARQQSQAFWLKVALAVVVLVLVMYAVRMYMKRKEAEREAAMLAEIPVDQPEVMDPKTVPLSQEEKERASEREAIEKMAKSKPEDVAQLIKVWLAEE